MRRALPVLLCLVPLLVASCTRERRLRMVVAPDSQTPPIARKLAEVLLETRGFELEVVEGEGSVANLERVQRGEADLTIVENSAPYRRGVRTILPLYRGVLHVLHEQGIDPGNASELLGGKTVFVGPRGGMGEWFLSLITAELGIPADSYELVEDAEVGPEVVFLFAPIQPSVARRIQDVYEFFSIGEPADLGRGAIVEGLVLEHPQMEPFVIPARTYGRANPEPVVTLSVSTLLVGRSELDELEIYDLVEIILSHKQELASVNPRLFTGITEDFDIDALNFPLHPGTRDYLARHEPTFLERYAELAGVSFTVSIALLSSLVALARWRERVKKNRIDAYYAKVLRVRAASIQYESAGAYEGAISKIEELQAQAFEQLMREKLAADESFRIFITLASDTLEDLERRRTRLAAAPALASASSGG